MEQFPDETTLTVVETVSDVLDIPHDELPPLSDSIDPDALDAAMAHNPASDVTVRFTYAGVRVVVSSRGTAFARPFDNEDDVPLTSSPP